jgi:succinyl-diaminopimelate desuccinylase
VAEPEAMEVCLWQKGALRLRLRFPGRMAHGAMPYAGDNPIPKAAQFVLALKVVEAHLQKEFPPPLPGPSLPDPHPLPGQRRGGAAQRDSR